MDWSAEALAVLATGVLFMGIVVAALTPHVSLSMTSFVAFGAAGVIFIGTAFALARVQAVNYPPVMWVLPVLPLLVIGVLFKDAVSARRAAEQPAHATAIARPDHAPSLTAAEAAPAGLTEPFRGGEGTVQALASSLYATPNELAHIAINNPELRPLLARNPMTPRSVLKFLSEQGDPDVLVQLQAREDALTSL